MTELEYIEEGMRRRNSGENAAVRAENVLMRFYCRKDEGRKPKSLMKRVENVFNGKPMTTDEVWKLFPEEPRERISMNLCALRQDGRLLGLGVGVFSKPHE